MIRKKRNEKEEMEKVRSVGGANYSLGLMGCQSRCERLVEGVNVRHIGVGRGKHIKELWKRKNMKTKK